MEWRPFVAIAAAMVHFAGAASAQGWVTQRARRELAFELPPDLPADRPRWVVDYALALEEAQRRNAPLIAVLSDEGAGFRSIAETVYARPEFAKFSRRCVLLAAYEGTKHPSKARSIEGSDVAWCELFAGPCEQHVQSYKRIQSEFARREFWNPLHLYLTTGGVELGRVEGHLTTQEQLDEELKRHREQFAGPAHDYEDYRELLTRLRAIVDAREKTSAARAHAELGKLVTAERRAIKEPGAKRPLKTEAMTKFVESLQGSLVLEGEGLLEDADELERTGDVEGARKLLLQVQKSWKGLAPATTATERLAKLPRPAGDR